MAKLESPLPAHHMACRLATELVPCAYVAGFLDGNATATVRSFRPGPPRPRLIIAARDDDPTPFSLWTSVGTYRGEPAGWLRHRPDLRRNEWIVDEPAELLGLIAWVRAVAEPLAPRLVAQLELVEMAAVLIGGPMSSREDLATLAQASNRLARSADPLPPTSALLEASEDRIWWEVAGLLASDGHLAIRDRHARYAPEASVSQRTDNAVLLETLQERTGLGDLVRQGHQLTWRVSRAAETQQLVDRLRTFQLPIASPRRRQMEVWALAVALKAAGGRGRGALADAADSLRSTRRYRGPTLLCTCPQPTSAPRRASQVGGPTL